MATLLFDAALTGSFQPTQAMLINIDKVTLDFIVTVAAGADASVEHYLEFCSNPADNDWRREVAEDNVGGGVVNMPFVVRNTTFPQSGTPNAASYHYVRQHQFVRAQLRVASGAVPNLKVYAPFGSIGR